MRSKIIIAMMLSTLLAAGCVQPIPKSSNPEPLGMPSPEGYVEFRNGFGKIPGLAPKATTASTGAQIAWSTNLPTPLTEATVLRREPTLPDPSFLENITTALRIPAGALRAMPVAERAQVQWRDDQQVDWTFDAETNRLSFNLLTATGTLTTTTLQDEGAAERIAYAFAKDRGLADESWGAPATVFSWTSWWKTETDAKRCMSAASLDVIRGIAAKPNVAPPFPALPSASTVACVTPEFPARILVRFQMEEDGQPVYTAASNAAIAEFVVRPDTNTVESGFVELPRELDRSNYPVKSQDDITNELRAGGIRGTGGLSADDRVDFSNFTYALYRHDADVSSTLRTFFIPALVATGRVTYASGASAPYTALVPLVSSDAYAEK